MEADQVSDAFADYLQKMVAFVLNRYYHGRCDSFNLFFFERNRQLIAKIVPRFIDSPYFVGYRLTQNFSDAHLATIGKAFQLFLQE